ncbi:MFS transporter [Rummeliibacillus sp. SL167]|uniref:MFS transporter n=1 Tax=Rummeliibacillus sp. SL167 TaxID=2579792 RepID=UPI0011B50BC1|nr:MFS transporter [Rummeliibacillus sp. SL167]
MKNIILLFTESFRIIVFEIFAIMLPLIGLKLLKLDNFSIGISLFLFSVGYLIFSYLAGKIVDSYNKKNLIIYIYGIEVILLYLFYIFIHNGNLSILIYYTLILIIGLSVVFIETAITAWIPDIYLSEELSNGAGVLQTGKSISNLIAPTIGGGLISLYGYNNTIIFLCIVLLINIPLIVLIKGYESSKKSKTVRKSTLKYTFEYIIKNPILKSIMFTTATINFSFSIYSSLIIIYLSKNFKLSEYIIGIILSISGIGALIGSVISSHLIKKFGSISIMIFGPIIPSFGLLLISIPKTKFYLLFIFIGIFLSLFSRSIGSIARLTVQSLTIPSEKRAEVNGTLMMFTWGMIPIGTLVGSYLSDILGIQKIMIMAGLCLIFSNFFMVRLWISNYKKTQRKMV